MEACMIPLKVLVLSTVGWGGNLDGVVLDFTARWCGPCQRLSPTVTRLQDEGYWVRKVDCDSNRDLMRQFRVATIPTFVLVIDGVEQGRLSGTEFSEERLKQLCARIPGQQDALAASRSPASRSTVRSDSDLGVPGDLPVAD